MLYPPDVPSASIQRQRGSISVGAILGVCLILVLVALGFAGYAWYTTRSDNARLARQIRDIETQKQKAEIEQKAAALQKEKADEEARLATARNLQEAFAARAQTLANALELLLTQIPAIHSRLETLRTAEEGRSVALHPDLVATADNLFQKDVRDLPSLPEAIQNLEAVRRLLFQVRDHAGSTFQPTPDMTAALDDVRVWTDTVNRRLQAAKSVAESLVREAKIKVPPQPLTAQSPTLEAAMEELARVRWQRLHQIESGKTEAAHDAAVTIAAEAQARKIVSDAQNEADRLRKEEEAKRAALDRELVEKQTAIQTANLQAKANTPEVVQALLPFTTPGYWNPGPTYTVELKPMSLAAIQKHGALNRTEAGIKNLQEILANPRDKIRPRMDRVKLRLKQDRYQDYAELQSLLIELGPTLVKLGRLQP